MPTENLNPQQLEPHKYFLKAYLHDTSFRYNCRPGVCNCVYDAQFLFTIRWKMLQCVLYSLVSEPHTITHTKITIVIKEYISVRVYMLFTGCEIRTANQFQFGKIKLFKQGEKTNPNSFAFIK